MALLKTFKVVSVLPGTLAADAIYAVRTGVGVALYVTDTTGAVAYALNNSGNVAASATLRNPGRRCSSFSDRRRCERFVLLAAGSHTHAARWQQPCVSKRAAPKEMLKKEINKN